MSAISAIYGFVKQTFRRLVFMFPAHFIVYSLTYLGVGPTPIPIISFLNLPIIYILVRKSPTLINLPLFVALALGAGMAHNEPTTSPMESYFDDFSILSLVGAFIAFVTLAPMVLTKFITIKIHEKYNNFTHNTNSRFIFPIIWTITWSIFRRYSPLGSWGDWSYTIDNSGYTGDPIIQIASIGGLSAINFFLALWMQVIADFLILRHRINRQTDTTDETDEQTPLILHHNDNIDNNTVYIEDFNKNYYLRMAMLAAILACFIIGGERLNNVESNINHLPTEKVGCVLPSNEADIDEMFKKTTTMATNLQAKIVLWSESAIALSKRSDYEELIERAKNLTNQLHFYLGITYTIPTDGKKKKNMLTFIGPGNETLFEYQKTHPVPLVESYHTESGSDHLSLVKVDIPKEKNKKEALNLTVSGAICLDMDFPELLNQAAGADLVLSPAQTWSAQIGLQHLRMSSVRAIENGYWILRCDGGGASGLIDSYGRTRHVQIASNDHVNMFVWEMPLNEERIKTYYADYGETTVWGALILMGICELIWHFSWNVDREGMESLTNRTSETIEGWKKWVDSKYNEIFDREELTPSIRESLI